VKVVGRRATPRRRNNHAQEDATKDMQLEMMKGLVAHLPVVVPDDGDDEVLVDGDDD
jgi:hypothetical protein